MNKEKLNNLNQILYALLSLTIFIGYFFGEDSSGSGGFIADFKSTWPVMSLIAQGEYTDFSEYTIHFPLHYFILYFLNNFFLDRDSVRLIFCVLSLITPYLFYLVLKLKYSKISINKLFLFSLVIFLMPSFRSGAIWANTQITALIFFLLFLIFFIKWEKNKSYRLNKEILFQCFFLSCAVYSRQMYAIIFLFVVYKYFINLNLKDFLKISIIIFIFSLPGFYLVIASPSTIKVTFDYSLYNSILINCSIICFYLIPYFIFSDLKNFQNLNKKNYFIFILLIFFLLIAAYLFDYNPKLGGGFFIKLSVLIFNNLYFFFLTSYLGLIYIYLLYNDDKESLIILALIILGFSSYQIFQKYFEPMFIILLFTLIKNHKNEMILNNYKNILLFNIYFIIYLLSAILNDIYKITKNFV
jgi:hypothetical protein